jgi:hypothetical protein
MICGYSNIYDLCSSKYVYEYASFILKDGYVIPNTGYDGSVYRIDKNTQEKVLLEPSSSLQIYSCDTNDENASLTAWECYLWYKNNNGIINNPSLSKYKEEQIKNVTTTYNKTLTNGILITIDNFATDITIAANGAYSNTVVSETTNYTILLPALNDDIINFSNILSLATLMNINDSKDPLPPLVDYYNNAHFLNYYNLTNILSNYFNKLKNYKLILDNTIAQINNASTIDDIQKQVFSTSLPTTTYNKLTNISGSNDIIIKFSTLSCEELNNLCDPPCDPNSCQECIDGSCQSLCEDGQYCCNGVCQNETCEECITNSDCGSGSCCVNGECIEAYCPGMFEGEPNECPCVNGDFECPDWNAGTNCWECNNGCYLIAIPTFCENLTCAEIEARGGWPYPLYASEQECLSSC